MVTTARAILDEMRRRGTRLTVEGDTLTAHAPKGRLADLVDMVPDYKREIIDLLQQEQTALDWRIDAMRPQVQGRGPVPFLVARRNVLGQDAPGGCLSCGEALPEGSRYRCPLCVRAAQHLLSEVRG